MQGEREATEGLACTKGLSCTSQPSCKPLASLYAHRALCLGVSGPGQPSQGCRGDPRDAGRPHSRCCPWQRPLAAGLHSGAGPAEQGRPAAVCSPGVPTRHAATQYQGKLSQQTDPMQYMIHLPVARVSTLIQDQRLCRDPRRCSHVVFFILEFVLFLERLCISVADCSCNVHNSCLAGMASGRS